MPSITHTRHTAHEPRPLPGLATMVVGSQHRAMRHAGWRTPWRTLPFALVEVPSDGAWQVETETDIWDAEAGQPFYISAGLRHRLRAREALASSWMYCSWQHRGLPLRLQPGAGLMPPDAVAIIQRMTDLLQSADDALETQLEVTILGLRLLGCLEPQWPSRPLAEPRIARALAYIHEHYAHPISREELATVAGLSVARFHELFLAEIGEPPMQTLRHLRLQQATVLLLNSDLSLTAIAARCGFASASYFSRYFSQQTGRCPSDLRRRRTL